VRGRPRQLGRRRAETIIATLSTYEAQISDALHRAGHHADALRAVLDALRVCAKEAPVTTGDVLRDLNEKYRARHEEKKP
jgi:hypothetical protein